MSRVRPDHPRCRSATWICTRGHTHDVVIYSKFYRFQFQRFRIPGGRNLPFPITLDIGFYNSSTGRKIKLCSFLLANPIVVNEGVAMEGAIAFFFAALRAASPVEYEVFEVSLRGYCNSSGFKSLTR